MGGAQGEAADVTTYVSTLGPFGGCAHCPAAVPRPETRAVLTILETSAEGVRDMAESLIPHRRLDPGKVGSCDSAMQATVLSPRRDTSAAPHLLSASCSPASRETFLQTRSVSTSCALDPCLRLHFQGPGHETGGNPGVPLLKIAHQHFTCTLCA